MERSSIGQFVTGHKAWFKGSESPQWKVKPDCLNCGKMVKRIDNKYCCKRCMILHYRGANHGSWKEVKCLICEKPLRTKQKWHQKFCSQMCYGVYFSGKYCGKNSKLYKERIPKDCEWCKKSFVKDQHQKRDRFCSPKCARFWVGNNKEIQERRIKKCIESLMKRPTMFEKKMIEIIQKNSLPYEYVGNGVFFIERLNPDFVNTNGLKVAVEVYYSYHKKRNYGSVSAWQDRRKDILEKYGWAVAFIDETEYQNESVVLSKIRQGEEDFKLLAEQHGAVCV